MQEKEIIINVLQDIKRQISKLDSFTDRESYFSKLDISEANKRVLNLSCVVESVAEYHHSEQNCFTFVMQVIEQKIDDDFHSKGTLSLVFIMKKTNSNDHWRYVTYLREANRETFLSKIDEYIVDPAIITDRLSDAYRDFLENHRPDSLDDDTKWV